MGPLVPILASGAAGGFVSSAASSGTQWLAQRFGSHKQAVQEEAQRNAQAFLDELATRVKALEDAWGADPLDRALAHPGTSLLLQEALLAAAVTAERPKHQLLSELIAHRLTSGPEDRVTLAGMAACQTLSSLSVHHLWQLGLLVLAHNLRPTYPIVVQTQEEYDAKVAEFFIPRLGSLANDRGYVPIDVYHLAGVSCVIYNPIAHYPLADSLILATTPQFKVTAARIYEALGDSGLVEVWNQGLDHAWPTSTGQLIGGLYLDIRFGQTTAIYWG